MTNKSVKSLRYKNVFNPINLIANVGRLDFIQASMETNYTERYIIHKIKEMKDGALKLPTRTNIKFRVNQSENFQGIYSYLIKLYIKRHPSLLLCYLICAEITFHIFKAQQKRLNNVYTVN